MSVIINGTTGITTPDIEVDTDTLYVDAANNRVGIGSSSPTTELHVKTGVNGGGLTLQRDSVTTGDYAQLGFRPSTNDIGESRGWIRGYRGSDSLTTYLTFGTNGTERMRIDSSGTVLVGCTAAPSSSVYGSGFVEYTNGRHALLLSSSTTSGSGLVYFYNPNGLVGSISTSGSSTIYSTSSDYRLKEDWVPMVDASTRVAALKPCNFAWKADGSRVDGFLAHELAEVIPEAVTGEKDAVDDEGNPDYQGIDQSKIVPLLTAALQEALTEIESLKTRVAALEGV